MSGADATGDLFAVLDDIPVARNADPSTSQQAAVSHTASGRRRTNAQQLLELIRRYPGRTQAEYAYLLKEQGMHWFKAARLTSNRPSDLIKAGLVREGEARTCSSTRAKARTYYPI